MTGTGGPTPYQLTVARIEDPRARHRVARWLQARVPGRELSEVLAALGRTGFVTQVDLGEGEARPLLQALYAAGAPLTSVTLVPADLAPPTAPSRPDPSLEAFARRGGGFRPTWSWPAFLFGPLWYLRHGLYAKGLCLLALSVLPIWGLEVTLLVSLLVLVYCGVAGRWDLYLWTVKRTQWW